MSQDYHVFNDETNSAVWICSQCTKIHIRHESVVVSIERSVVANILRCFSPFYTPPICEECGCIHLNVGPASLHLSTESYTKLMMALSEFVPEQEILNLPTMDLYHCKN